MPRIPVETQITITLAQSLRNVSRSPAARKIVAIPDESNWNDFSKNFHMQLHFMGFDRSHEPLAMRLMFDGAPRTAAKVRTILDGRAERSISELDQNFVSALDHPTTYRTLVARLGFEDAFASLRVMHDIVVARLEGVDTQTMALADGIDFAEGVLRNDRVWAAIRNGERYLTATGAPDVEDSAHSFVAKVQLSGMPGAHVLDADFGNDFPLSRRSLVLVGENGVGKTRLLRALIQGLQNIPEWELASNDDFSKFAPRPKFSRLVAISSAASDSYPASLPPWRGIDYRFHRMAGSPSGLDDNLAQSLVDCLRLDAALDELSDVDRMSMLDEVLEPLEIKRDFHVRVTAEGDEQSPLPSPTESRGELYLPFFRISGEQRRLHLHARMITTSQPVIIDTEGRIRELSSGEQALLRFAIHTVGSVRSGTLFILDEPETHLHPNYISKLMSMLDRLLEASKSIAIVATHSAYIVREVPARRVRIVRINESEEIAIDPPGLQTFGASIDTISQFVFGDISPRHRFQEVLDRWLQNSPNASIATFRERFREDLNAETLSYLAQSISESPQE